MADDEVDALYDSWRDWPKLPPGWRPADPRVEVRNTITNPPVLRMLRRALPGTWKKVYLHGADGTQLHYFRHASGKIALAKIK